MALNFKKSPGDDQLQSHPGESTIFFSITRLNCNYQKWVIISFRLEIFVYTSNNSCCQNIPKNSPRSVNL